MTSQVLRHESYKFDAAMKFAKSRLTDYRTEEQRKVVCKRFMHMYYGLFKYMQCLGLPPYKNHKSLPTHQLYAAIIKSMNGSEDHEAVYVRYLALFVSMFTCTIFMAPFIIYYNSLQRLFIRHCNSKSQATHSNFNSWTRKYYNEIEEEEWISIMQSDVGYDYEKNGHGLIEVAIEQS